MKAKWGRACAAVLYFGESVFAFSGEDMDVYRLVREEMTGPESEKKTRGFSAIGQKSYRERNKKLWLQRQTSIDFCKGTQTSHSP